jgi:hypothetical protein
MDHKHEIEYKLYETDDGVSQYAKVHLVFKCGCKITLDNIRSIAKDLYEQFGWSVVKTKGFSSGHNYIDNEMRYIIRVKRDI